MSSEPLRQSTIAVSIQDLSAVIMSPAADSDRVEIALWGWSENEIEIFPDDSLRLHCFTS